MASVSDINVNQAVGKFLQRQSITPPADSTANTADEINAVLETIATAFLLYPQAALTLIMNAKNSLQQVVQADQSVVEFMLSALGDVNNQDVPITDSSDLVEAQTALVELDRLGRVDSSLQAFSRYQSAINRFLNVQLAPTLKRNSTGTFERTGDEARQDLFNILPQFVAAHGVMISLLKPLQNSINDFKSVNLTTIVSSTTISRVRSSLNRVKSRVDTGNISKTTTAIELLSGAASLTSISSTGDIFDPAIQTGSIPVNTNITMQPEDAKASALSTSGPWNLGAGPWNFIGTVDPQSTAPQPFNFEIPAALASGKVYVSSEGLGPTFNIPASGTLYVSVQDTSTTEFEAVVTSGSSVSLLTLVSDLDSLLSPSAGCIINPGTNGFVIVGSPTATSITIRSSATGASGAFSTNPSIHEILGFTAGQTSAPLGHFDAESLAAAIKNQLPGGVITSIEGDKVRITSSLASSALSSLFFNDSGTNEVQSIFGYSGIVEAQPSFFELVDGAIISPNDVGVYIGSIITAEESPSIPNSSIRTLNNESITDIQGTRIFIDSNISIPRRNTSLEVTSTIVSTVQKLVQGLVSFSTLFDQDTAIIQRILSPIVSKPTQAQIGDARRAIQDVDTRLQSLLDFLTTFSIRPDQSQFASTASQILSSLEERGLDRAQDLLSSGQFSMFFALDSTNSSKSNRLLTAMENVANQDLPVSTLEVDIDDDVTPRGTNPDSNVLAGAELQGSGSLVTSS